MPVAALEIEPKVEAKEEAPAGKPRDAVRPALIVSLLAALTLLIQAGHALNTQSCRASFCIQEVLVLAVVVPSAAWAFWKLGVADDRSQQKQEQVKKQREALAEAYGSLVSCMEDLLGKATKSSAMLAESNFLSKRKDFLRFLERAERSRAGDVKKHIGNPFEDEDDEAVVREFRRFVRRWLVIFEECSADPVRHPHKVVSDKDLDACATTSEIAALVSERLKATEVRFVTAQRHKDERVVRGWRSHCPAPVQKALPPVERPKDEARSFEVRSFQEPEPQQPEAPPHRTRCPAWLEPGCTGLGASRSDAGSVCQGRCLCFSVSMLSFGHGLLLAGYMAGLVVLGLDLAKAVMLQLDVPALTVQALVVMLIYELSVMVVLSRFETVDVFCALAAEERFLVQENERLADKQEKISNYWGSMQNCTDIWLHRTVPRLDLIKEVQCKLEDAPVEDLLPLMASSSKRLEELEVYVGSADNWQNHGRVSEASKRAFGERLRGVYESDSLPSLIHNLAEVVEEGQLQVEFARASQPGTDVGPAVGLPPVMLPRGQIGAGSTKDTEKARRPSTSSQATMTRQNSDRSLKREGSGRWLGSFKAS